MRFAASKCKVLLQDCCDHVDLMLDDVVIEVVDRFVYLGSCIRGGGGGVGNEIEARISKARTVFANLGHLWRQRCISLKLKGRVYKTTIERLIKALEDEHCQYRHESDAKHLLISEINALRTHYDELDDLARQTQAKNNEVGDPTLLRIALEQARKAQSESAFELTKIKTEYVEVVPKKQYENLLKLGKDQENKMKEQEERYAELSDVLK
ncbi:uncharacterized protein DEA37_0009716 [Paragonimus westermani]|uniref:Uncharacterized protein n=1 Tax=Paragonimus westermani TaxID=34504 RepID=A0A5J4NDD5_9TREM|nr:uncharacterized protein DEA37_0009716 [Paragonimus westermani]